MELCLSRKAERGKGNEGFAEWGKYVGCVVLLLLLLPPVSCIVWLCVQCSTGSILLLVQKVLGEEKRWCGVGGA